MEKVTTTAESIREWEHKHGESFVDRFESNLKASTFMTWCYGKGYLSSEQYNEWLALYVADDFEADCANYFVSSDGTDNTWAVVQYDESTDEAYEESYRRETEVLGEFIDAIDLYKVRFEKFMSEEESE